MWNLGLLEFVVQLPNFCGPLLQVINTNCSVSTWTISDTHWESDICLAFSTVWLTHLQHCLFIWNCSLCRCLLSVTVSTTIQYTSLNGKTKHHYIMTLRPRSLPPSQAWEPFSPSLWIALRHLGPHRGTLHRGNNCACFYIMYHLCGWVKGAAHSIFVIIELFIVLYSSYHNDVLFIHRYFPCHLCWTSSSMLI